MRKKWKIMMIVSILVIVLSLPIFGYFYLIGLFDTDRQTVEIERSWTNEEEEKALIAAENLDYWSYLKVTRYREGNTTGIKDPSDPNYIDHKVIEDGKSIISYAKRPFNTVRNRFEYSASCAKVESLTVDMIIDNTTHRIESRIVWSGDNSHEISFSIDFSGQVIDDNCLVFFNEDIIASNQTFHYVDLYVISMETMLDSYHEIWEMGGGDGVYQVVLIDENHDVTMIISQRIELVT